MSRLFGAFLAIALMATPASAKTVLVVRGIFGNIVAPMTEIINAEQAAGNKVIVAEWYAVPNVKADIAIGHSAGADAVLRSGAKDIRTIDPTFLNGGCPQGATCKNWYAPIDAFPFLFCCGGYPVNGAQNIVVPGTPSFIVFAPGHVSMPSRVVSQVTADH